MKQIALFFLASILCTTRLWAQTPELIADLNPLTAHGFNQFETDFITLGDKALFVANNGQSGNELYALQGNSISLVKDIIAGTTSSEPQHLTKLGDKVYFAATDSAHGRELWVSDGTPDGTQILYDLQPGPTGSAPQNIYASESGFLLFESAHDVFSIVPGNDPINLSMASYVDLSPNFSTLGQKVAPFAGGLAFTSEKNLSSDSIRLWYTDGTLAGTRKLASFGGSFSGEIHGLIGLENKLLFALSDPVVNTLNGYYAVGSNAGAPIEPVVFAGSDDSKMPQRFLPADGSKAFFYSSEGMYATDGSLSGTVKITGNLLSFLTQGAPFPFAYLNGKAIFPVDAGFETCNVYVSDGTVAGTNILTTLQEEFVGQLMLFDGKVLFASGTSNGFKPKIWISDLTVAGTKSVYSYSSNSTSGPSIVNMGILDGYLYFQSNLGGVGRELYRIKPSTSSAVESPNSAPVNYHLAYSGATGMARIWKDTPNSECIFVSIFDASGRQVQQQQVVLGEAFYIAGFSGFGVVQVNGVQGQQAFKIIR